MKCMLIIAAKVVEHRESGTFSVAHGGVSRAAAGQEIELGILAIVKPEPDDFGKHTIQMRCMDIDGKDSIAPLSRPLMIGDDCPQQLTLIVQTNITFPRTGRYGFHLLIDDHEVDRSVITVVSLERFNGDKPDSTDRG